jgi:hypothetical protein
LKTCSFEISNLWLNLLWPMIALTNVGSNVEGLVDGAAVVGVAVGTGVMVGNDVGDGVGAGDSVGTVVGRKELEGDSDGGSETVGKSVGVWEGIIVGGGGDGLVDGCIVAVGRGVIVGDCVGDADGISVGGALVVGELVDGDRVGLVGKEEGAAVGSCDMTPVKLRRSNKHVHPTMWRFLRLLLIGHDSILIDCSLPAPGTAAARVLSDTLLDISESNFDLEILLLVLFGVSDTSELQSVR